MFWGDMNLKYHVVNRFYLPARVLCVFFYDNIDKVYVIKKDYQYRVFMVTLNAYK